MRRIICSIILFATCLGCSTNRTYDITAFGASTESENNAPSINEAIETCHSNGGGIVIVPDGDFKTGTVVLKSGVTLYLERGAKLSATENLEEYLSMTDSDNLSKYDSGEGGDNSNNSKDERWNRALVLAVGEKDIAIKGEGTIDGGHIFDPQGEEHMRGPHTILFSKVKGFSIEGISIIRAANYAYMAYEVEDGVFNDVKIDEGWDGIHIRGGKDIRITHCSFRTGDDSVAGGYWDRMRIQGCDFNTACNGIRIIMPVSDVTVDSCRFHGPGEFAHRTSKELNRRNMLAALNIQPGGWGKAAGNVEDVVIKNVVIDSVATPLMVTLNEGNDCGRIRVDNMVATRIYGAAVSIESWKGGKYDTVRFKDTSIEYIGADDSSLTDITTCQPPADYRPLPCWGMFVKDVNRLKLDNVTLSYTGKEYRPALLFDNVGECIESGFNYGNHIILPEFFSDHMVLQQQAVTAVRGHATPGKKVTLQTGWDGKSYVAQVDKEGEWKVSISTPEAGGPYSITMEEGDKALSRFSRNALRLNDILIGDVWFCAGQSNMEMPFDSQGWSEDVFRTDEEKKASVSYTGIRLLNVAKKVSIKPEKECAVLHGGWLTCNEKNLSDFSCTAYFYGKNLADSLNVPIGLICSAWGGTALEPWTDAESASKMPSCRPMLEELSQFEEVPYMDFPRYPASIYNAMVSPFTDIAIKGAIWYQGCSSTPRAWEYKDLLCLMVNGWRENWGSDFPFYIAQIAPFNAIEPYMGWAEVREKQQVASECIDNSGIALTIDIGDYSNIHPINKQEIGRRLALTSLARTYGHNISYNGPKLSSYKIENGCVRVRVSGCGEGLKTGRYVLEDLGVKFEKEPVIGFLLAGPDGVFYPAQADIVSSDEILVRSENVPDPIDVRYAFDNYVEVNLYNSAGLPAHPFRTDSYKLTEP